MLCGSVGVFRLQRVKKLSPIDVHVWTATPDAAADPQLEADLLALLDEDERARLEKLRRAPDRKAFLVRRALLRIVLADQAGMSAVSLRYTTARAPEPSSGTAEDRWGRLELAPGCSTVPLRFSLSGCDGLVACAVRIEHEVGVDVEAHDVPRDTDAIARRMFSPSERAALEVAQGASRRELFYRHWTLKEAYAKARGLGLALPLASVSFSVADPIRAAIEPRVDTEPASWCFGLQSPSARHTLALATRGLPGQRLERTGDLRVSEFLLSCVGAHGVSFRIESGS